MWYLFLACSCAEHINASLGIFKSRFLNQSYGFSFSVPSDIYLINCLYIYFSFQFSTIFSFSDFLKPFFETLSLSLSELQNPDMFYSFKQILIRILKVPSKIIFFSCNCTFKTHQSSSSLFSTNVTSVCITFCVESVMHCEEFPSLPI